MNLTNNSPIIWGSTGALSLQSALVIPGSTSGTFTLQPAAVTTSYSITMPGAQATGSGQTLVNNGSGTLSWGDISSLLSLGPVGSSPNANAATLTAGVLNLQPASGSFPGVITTGTQTIAGTKTFSSSPIISTLTASRVVYTSGSSALQTDNNLIWTGSALYVNTAGSAGSATLDMRYTASTSAAAVQVYNNGSAVTSGYGPLFSIVQSGSTNTNNILGSLAFAGGGGPSSTYPQFYAAAITAQATDVWASSQAPTALKFYTTGYTTSNSLVLTLDSDQTSSFQNTVKINPTITAATPRALQVSPTLVPSTGSAILQAIVSSAAFNATVANSVNIAANFYASPFLTGNTGTISNLAGFYYDGGGTSVGTVTNSYGLYVATPAAGTNKYGAYIASPVGIGIAAPNNTLALDVNGNLGIANNLALQWKTSGGTPTTVLYMDTGNTVRLKPGSGGTLYLNPDQNLPTQINYNNNNPVQVGNSSTYANLNVYGQLFNQYNTGVNFYSLYKGSAGQGCIAQLVADPGTAMLNGNGLGQLIFAGAYNSSGSIQTGAVIVGTAQQNWTTGASGGGLQFWTVANNTNSGAIALTLAQDQNATFTKAVAINGGTTSSPATGLTLGYDSGSGYGFAQTYASLPLKLNPLGNTVYINGLSGTVSANSGAISVYASPTPSSVRNGTLLFDNDVTGKAAYRQIPLPQKNYIVNPGFENGIATSGWALCGVTMSGTTPTGAISAPSGAITATATSTNPINGNYSLQIAAASNWTAGQGFYQQFVIDNEYKASSLSIQFAYQLVSGTGNWSGTSSNTLACWIQDGGTGIWIQPAGVWNFVQNSGIGKFVGSFQTSSSSTTYILTVLCINSTGSAMTVNFDDFFVGPAGGNIAPVLSDWVSYTPSCNWTNQTTTGKWRREGDSIWCLVRVALTGTPAGGALQLGIPSGLTIDTTKFISTTSILSDGEAVSSGVGVFHTFCQYATTTTVYATYINSGTNSLTASVTPTLPFSFKNTDYIDIQWQVPISGWSSNAVSSADSDQRLVAMRYTSTTSVSAPNTTQTVMPYNNLVYDSHSAFSTSTYLYTVPVPGMYQVSAAFDFATNSTNGREMWLWVNGSQVAAMASQWTPPSTNNAYMYGSTAYYCTAGQTIQIKGVQNSGGSLTMGSTLNANYNWISIERIGGAPIVQAADSVGAYVTGQPTGTLNSSYNTITFPTITKDYTGSYSSGNYTVPVSGTYNITATVAISGSFVNGTIANTAIYINGSLIAYQSIPAGNTGSYTIQPTVTMNCYPCNAGDIVTVRCQTGATTPTFSATSGASYFSISRVGN